MKRTRTENAAINVFIGITYQIVVILLGFISRKIFVLMLDVEYLGINGILNNILSVLSLSELGISGAIIYSLYKPVANNDKKKISALINYYRKLYMTIAIIIFCLGIILIPFLQYIIKLSIPINEIIMYYMLYLINTVVSYLITYKTAILMANQKEYICKKYMLIISILQFILQVIAIVTIKSFFLYICIQIACSVISNYICSKKAEKLYPYINEKETLEKKEKKDIWNNIKSMFLYRLGGVMLNNTDNILISIIVGTVVVGYYSNYSMIVTQVAAVCAIIFTAMQASLGNLAVEGDEERKFFIFKVLQMMSRWIYGFCSVCLIVLLQDFIQLWLGKDFLLENNIIYASILNFYSQGIVYPIACYRNTTGLFRYTKYTMIFASIINIILSIIGGKIYGLIGILIATTVARFLTSLWYEPLILFKKYFHKHVIKYYFEEICGAIIVIIMIILTVIICNNIPFNGLVGFILKCCICVIVPNAIFMAIFWRKEEFQYLKNSIVLKIKENKNVLKKE